MSYETKSILQIKSNTVHILFPMILAAPLGLIEVDGKNDASILAKSYGNNMIFIFS